MSNFIKAFNIVVSNEGGYVDNPNDSGGETYMGVTRKGYPNLSLWYKVDVIKKAHKGKVASKVLAGLINKDLNDNMLACAEVQDIYKTNYWNKCKCDEIKWPLNCFVFDFAVNAGNVRAIKTLQRMVKAIPDGIIGFNTLSAVNAYTGSPAEYLDMRIAFYQNLVEKEPKNKVFLNGWTNRVNSLKCLIS